jgi:hypothetical protein
MLIDLKTSISIINKKYHIMTCNIVDAYAILSEWLNTNKNKNKNKDLTYIIIFSN